MRLSTTAIAFGLTLRDGPVAGAALLALLLVAAMLHQDMRTTHRDQRSADPPNEAAAPVDAPEELRVAALEPVVLQPPPAAPAVEPEPSPPAEAVPPEPPAQEPPAQEPPAELAEADPPAEEPVSEPLAASAVELDGTEPEVPLDVAIVAEPPATEGEPVPAPLPAAAPIVAQPPAPRPEREALTTVTLRPGEAIESRGRVLLQLLESGSGPNVVIHWPASVEEQERLAAMLVSCHGMELALLRPDNTVLRADDPPGLAEPLDFDRWSRFPRAPSGVVTAYERTIETALRGHHRGAAGLFDSRPVRLFPRLVDAALLGGLEALLGRDYAGAKEVHLAYELRDGVVRLVDLRRDGVPVPGALELSRVGPCTA